VTLEDLHLEGYATGIEVAAHASNANRINGVNIINVSANSGAGVINTVIDISNDPTVGGSTEVNILGLSAPVGATITNLLNDHIMGTIISFSTEKSLSSYILGRVLSANGGRLRFTSSPSASNVVPSTAAGYTMGTTYTAQNLGCFSAVGTVSDCTTNDQFIGVNLAGSGSFALVQTTGDVMVNLDGVAASVSLGDFICISSTAGKATDSAGTPCGSGNEIGIAAQGAGGHPTQALVHLRLS
jgi:hypothetical protein